MGVEDGWNSFFLQNIALAFALALGFLIEVSFPKMQLANAHSDPGPNLCQYGVLPTPNALVIRGPSGKIGQTQCAEAIHCPFPSSWARNRSDIEIRHTSPCRILVHQME